MEGSTAVVGLNTLAQEGHVLELVADEGARDLDLLSADHNNLLALEELLGHNGGQASEQMALAVNDHGLKKEKIEKINISQFPPQKAAAGSESESTLH